MLLLIVACVPAAPGASPSSSATPADQPAFTLELETGGQTTRVLVLDPEDLVVEAWPADPPEAAAALNSLTTSDIVILRGESDAWVVVAWLVTPCDRQATLTVVARVITVELPPRPGCDALAIGRAVALRMADPGRAALFEARLVDAPILPDVEPPTPVAPPPTAEG